MPTRKFMLFSAAVVGLFPSLASAGAASATPGHTVAINPGNVPATAADYEHECSANLGGGPYPGKDVWVFNLPGKAATTGSFTTITATFDTDHDGTGDTTVLIDPGPADGDDIVTVGHSKAYAITAAGWTLTGATATITGEADKFVLTHTCPAKTPVTPPTTATGKPTSPAGTPTTASTTSPAPGAGAARGSGGKSSGALAVTGANAGGAAVLGLGLVGGGAALLLLRRRRRFTA